MKRPLHSLHRYDLFSFEEDGDEFTFRGLDLLTAHIKSSKTGRILQVSAFQDVHLICKAYTEGYEEAERGRFPHG